MNHKQQRILDILLMAGIALAVGVATYLILSSGNDAQAEAEQAPTTSAVGEGTVVLSSPTTLPPADPTTTSTSTPETTITTVALSAREVFFASVPASYYEGMTEDDAWTLVQGACMALDTMTPQEVIDQTLADTGGLIDLTELITLLDTLGTCG